MKIATATRDPLGDVSYEDLYRRWEHGQWRSTELDFSIDAVFFHRFMKEVVGIGGHSVADGLKAVEPSLNWGFRKVFGRLVHKASSTGPEGPSYTRQGCPTPAAWSTAPPNCSGG